MVRQQLTHLMTVMRRMQQDPTPTPGSVQVQLPPTQTPEGVDQIAIPPTPTPTPRDVTPTPTSSVQISAPREETPTPTSTVQVSDPREETPTPTPFPPSPTPVQVEEQPEQDEPEKLSLFNTLCGPGPWHPWYPLVAPPDVTALSGVRWYGVQLDADSNTLTAAAFHQDGGEVSRGEVSRDSDGGYRWNLSDADTRIEASFAVVRAGAGGRIVGEIAGQPFILSVGGEEPPVLDMDAAVSLGEAEQRLMGQWVAVIPKYEGLFEVFASGGDAATGTPAKCFASGFLLLPSIISCPVTAGLGCAAASVFGGYIWSEC